MKTITLTKASFQQYQPFHLYTEEGDKTRSVANFLQQDELLFYWIPPSNNQIDYDNAWDVDSTWGEIGILGKDHNDTMIFETHSIAFSNSALKTKCFTALYTPNLAKRQGCCCFQLQSDSKHPIDFFDI